MIIQNIVYLVLDALFIYYIVRKYVKSHNKTYLYISILQIVNTVIQITALIIGIKINWYMQIYFLLINYIVPSLILWADFSNVDLDEFLRIKLGDYYARKENYTKAIDYYKQALTKNPNNSKTYSKIKCRFLQFHSTCKIHICITVRHLESNSFFQNCH